MSALPCDKERASRAWGGELKEPMSRLQVAEIRCAFLEVTGNQWKPLQRCAT